MFRVRKNLQFIVTPQEGEAGAGPAEDQSEETPKPEEGDGGEPEETPENEDEGFDPARALAKIRKVNSENKNLRAENKRLKEAAGKPPAEDPEPEAEDEGPTREELLAKVARLEILAENGVPTRFAKFITATEPDEIREQVEELLGLAAPTKPAGNGRPKPVLHNGRAPQTEVEETDPRKLAARVPRQ